MGNLGLLFMLLFFIYAALGVELFGELGRLFQKILLMTMMWLSEVFFQPHDKITIVRSNKTKRDIFVDL